MLTDPVLTVAERAARRASAVIVDAARDLKRQPSHVRQHGEVVANAGVEAENAVIATLRAAFPDHGIAGRESGENLSRIGAATAARSTFQRLGLRALVCIGGDGSLTIAQQLFEIASVPGGEGSFMNRLKFKAFTPCTRTSPRINTSQKRPRRAARELSASVTMPSAFLRCSHVIGNTSSLP